MRLAGFDVKRILVDQGSSCKVMYFDLYKQLGLKDSQLTPTQSPLVGFNGSSVWPLGKVTLPVVIGSVQNDIEFMVVNVSSTYNAIVGKTWIRKFKAVPE
ncbi:hypothetical protein Vadar_025113 [Vaccinium darrowii]|uniref:Uncharacterized protein n=1 Tax=Vaccinium darrowii TaxID=229202 RepID=A0ACB7YGE8_9ERIC|nr:hypothetical protein Vadar_025113 [Vaccinium darrowii]